MKKLIYFLFFLFSTQFIYAQEDTTGTKEEVLTIEQIEPNSFGSIIEKKPTYFERAWAPIGLGLISIDLLRDSTKYGLQNLARSFVADTFRTHVDDWIHYIPVLTMYTADLFKVPSKNTIWNQTKFLIMSEVITSGIVLSLKYGLGIQRPNNGAYNAYPSGHTSQAFVQSQVLFNEFRDTAPLLASSGYLFSISTGVLRILNNRHWVPDVLLGAGIGMLVTNTIYYFEPLKNWNPFKRFKKSDNTLKMSFIPTISDSYLGGNLRLQF